VIGQKRQGEQEPGGHDGGGARETRQGDRPGGEANRHGVGAHDPDRPRKLLLHNEEIKRIAARV
jgi:hypothetical protein